MDWQAAVKNENLVHIIKDYGDGWWIFQYQGTSPYYRGILGWHSFARQNKGFFAVQDPAQWIEHNLAIYGMNQEKRETFCDGRQLKWIVREFLPPESHQYARDAIKSLNILSENEIQQLEQIREKLYPLQKSGTPQHRDALKIAKANRVRIKRKWDAGKNLTKRPPYLPMPEKLKQHLVLLNGGEE